MTGNEELLIDIDNGHGDDYQQLKEADTKNNTAVCNDSNINCDAVTNNNSSTPPRKKPIIHPSESRRVCDASKHKRDDDNIGLDCPECLELLMDPATTIPQIFAAMREWIPANQKRMDLLIAQLLEHGIHMDDMDGLEGNTMLHYACKSASEGVGDLDTAKSLVKKLLDLGASYKVRSRWTDMLPLHVAAYFDCPDIIEILLNASSNSDINSRCKEYLQGTALHIAASGLSINAVKCLLDRGIDPTLITNEFKTAFDCIEDGTRNDIKQPKSTINELKRLLKNPVSPDSGPTLKELGLHLGDSVVVNGDKRGILRFCGRTEFASGIWCGVEIVDRARHEKTDNRSDGSVAGVTYFRCPPATGVFTTPSKIQPLKGSGLSFHDGADGDERKSKIHVGDRVSVIGCKGGYVRFIGKVKFSSAGVWVGVELDKPYGKCDGSVDNVRYFQCKPQHGIIVTQDKIKPLLSTPSAPKSTKTSRPQSLASPLSPSPSIDSNRAISSPMRGSTPRTPNIMSPTLTRSNRNLFKPTARQSSSDGRMARSSSGSKLTPNKSNVLSSPSADDIYKKKIKLQPGMNVFVNGDIGIVKYIGRVDFSDGIWIGLMLKAPNGKNDGTVQGKKYFTCKPGYGLMVKPTKVTVHGINASKLIDESDYPPFKA